MSSWFLQPGVPADLKEMVDRDFVRQVSDILGQRNKFDANYLLEMDRIVEVPTEMQHAALDKIFSKAD